MSDSGLSVCVLSNRSLARHQVLALTRMVEETNATVSLVVVNDPSVGDNPVMDDPGRDGSASPKGDQTEGDAAINNPRRFGAADLRLFADVWREDGAWALVRAAQKLAWMVRGPTDRWEYMQTTPVEEVGLLSETPILRCEPVSEGAWNELPPEVVDRIADQADVVVRFGFGLLRGEVLTATEHGVLSFHPADVRKYRGQGPEQIFWNGDDVAGVTLQQLTADIDAGRIVRVEDVDVSDVYTYDQLWAEIWGTQIDMLAEGIREIQQPEFAFQEVTNLGEYYPHDQRRKPYFVLRFLMKDLYGHLRTILGSG